MPSTSPMKITARLSASSRKNSQHNRWVDQIGVCNLAGQPGFLASYSHDNNTGTVVGNDGAIQEQQTAAKTGHRNKRNINQLEQFVRRRQHRHSCRRPGYHSTERRMRKTWVSQVSGVSRIRVRRMGTTGRLQLCLWLASCEPNCSEAD